MHTKSYYENKCEMLNFLTDCYSNASMRPHRPLPQSFPSSEGIQAYGLRDPRSIFQTAPRAVQPFLQSWQVCPRDIQTDKKITLHQQQQATSMHALQTNHRLITPVWQHKNKHNKNNSVWYIIHSRLDYIQWLLHTNWSVFNLIFLKNFSVGGTIPPK